MARTNTCRGAWRLETYQTLFQCDFILNESTKLQLTPADIEVVHFHHHAHPRGGSMEL